MDQEQNRTLPTEGDVQTIAQPRDATPQKRSEITIDRYSLLQKIGEGGMGEVWLAEQREPIRRRVAVKLIRTGTGSGESIARFQSERQALALMDHPAIARVFDAGVTAQGSPYFVMEYVAGVPITEYCDAHRLSARDRLELFIRICDGVSHAHQKAIIHRDLKPSNILVTETDGRAAPKIIDFGIAKALEQPLTTDVMTRAGSLIGTPGYMSPEQARSSGVDIDTRTDVYSLGVILYELLVGVRPFEFSNATLDEFLHRLLDEEPPRLSTRIHSRDRVAQTELASRRQTDPPGLVRSVRGDLEAIVSKTLEKDRSRRYGSVSELADDIDRYLKDDVVLARSPSVAYRSLKFARRHRVGVAMSVVLVVVLIGTTTVTIWQSVRASQQAALAQSVDDFLQNDLLAQAGSNRQAQSGFRPDPELKVRTALDRAATRLEGRFLTQPLIEASVRDTLGTAYVELGLYREAQGQYERAVDLRRGHLGAEHPDTLKSMTGLVAALTQIGQLKQAEVVAARVLEIRRRVLGELTPDTLASVAALASIYYARADYAKAELVAVEVLEARRRLLGGDHPDTVNSMFLLAQIYLGREKYAEAEPLWASVVESRRRRYGLEFPGTITALGNQAITLYGERRYNDAEMAARQAIELSGKIFGESHPTTIQQRNVLEAIYYDEGKYAQAETVGRAVLEGRQRAYGPNSIWTLRTMSNLAEIYWASGQLTKAEDLNRQTLEAQVRVLGPNNLDTLASQALQAKIQQDRGHYAEAERLWSTLLQSQMRALGPRHPDTLATTTGLSRVELRRKKWAEAEASSKGALQGYEKDAPDNWMKFVAQSVLGASLEGQRKYAEAEPLMLAAYEGLSQWQPPLSVPDRRYVKEAGEGLRLLYTDWGKLQEAGEWRNKLRDHKASEGR